MAMMTGNGPNQEPYYEKLLHIKTGGSQESHMGFHYYRYEPTPYHALEQLFQQYDGASAHQFVDFGCGKGRFPFFVHHFYGARTVGVEMNDSLFERAQENLKNYMIKNHLLPGHIQFHHCLAENYRVQPTDDRFYFFNPFSVQIFMKVMGNILKSFEDRPREMQIILYYPSEEYTFFLDNRTVFQLQAEILLEDEFFRNPNERFLIYEIR
jgi:SAM-dependent methyltransferase